MFTEGAKNIHLDGNILKADIPDDEGNMKKAQIDLNEHVKSDYGHLRWGKGGFSQFLSQEAESEPYIADSDDGPALNAKLRTGRDFLPGPVHSELPLNWGITNKNGELVYDPLREP